MSPSYCPLTPSLVPGAHRALSDSVCVRVGNTGKRPRCNRDLFTFFLLDEVDDCCLSICAALLVKSKFPLSSLTQETPLLFFFFESEQARACPGGGWGKGGGKGG